MLNQANCVERLGRFRRRMEALGVDVAAVTDARDIYYLTGTVLPSRFTGPVCMLVHPGGPVVLFAQACDGAQGVDECMAYEWDKLGTMNPDHTRLLAAAIAGHLAGVHTAARIGWQAESMPRQVGETLAHALRPDAWVGIDDALADLQRRKDPDEVALLRLAARTNLAAYTAVQAAITPGAIELEVLATGQRAAQLAAGERVYHDGDYRSGERGGLARNRAIEAGEFYIIDAQTQVGGYWSDLSRAYVVGGAPSPLQQSLYEHIAEIQNEVPSMLKPGAEGRDIWRWMDRRVREHPALADEGLAHHAGHSIGLHPHELPDLGRERGGVLEPGTVVSVEPGGYVAAARCGVRIENTYLITETGNVNLSEYPMNIAPIRAHP